MSDLCNYNELHETMDHTLELHWLTENPPHTLVVASTLLQYDTTTKSRAVVGHTDLYINRATLMDLININTYM